MKDAFGVDRGEISKGLNPIKVLREGKAARAAMPGLKAQKRGADFSHAFTSGWDTAARDIRPSKLYSEANLAAGRKSRAQQIATASADSAFASVGINSAKRSIASADKLKRNTARVAAGAAVGGAGVGGYKLGQKKPVAKAMTKKDKKYTAISAAGMGTSVAGGGVALGAGMERAFIKKPMLPKGNLKRLGVGAAAYGAGLGAMAYANKKHWNPPKKKA